MAAGTDSDPGTDPGSISGIDELNARSLEVADESLTPSFTWLVNRIFCFSQLFSISQKLGPNLSSLYASKSFNAIIN